MNFSKARIPILFGSLVLVIIVWWIVAVSSGFSGYPGPVGTGLAFVQLFTTHSLSSLLVSALGTTMYEVVLGFVLAIAVGFPVGVLMGRYVLIDNMLDPWVNAWYSIPAIAFIPLTMNWTGLTSTSAMIISFLIATFMIIINTYTGVKNVSRNTIEPALAFGSSGRQALTKVILPASLPQIMVGLRLGITRAIDGVIIAEMVFSVSGLGGMIFDTADKVQLNLAVALVIILSVIGLAVNEIMKYLSKKAVPWKETEAMFRQ
ncbi:MAG: ABC transporter permease [Nitrososphaerota archaeon]|nr:ABC transporter permease [Nitrososphaerota archaeon]